MSSDVSEFGFVLSNYGGAEPTDGAFRIEIATTDNTNQSPWSATTYSTAFYVNGSGYVGIGNASPSDILEIQGAGNANGLEFAGEPVQIDTGSTNSDFAMYMGADTTHAVSYIQSVQVSTAPANLALNARGGNVGIGTTSPVSLFTVNGDIDVAASSYLNFGSTDGSSGYGFRDHSGTMQAKISGGSWANISTASDQRLKRDIVPLPQDDGLASLMKLRPVRFHWKDAEQDKTEGEQIGLIAQEVEKVYPTGDVVYNYGNVTMDLGNGKKQTIEHARGLKYDKLVPPLIKALQEQQAEIQQQDAKMQIQDAAIRELKQEIADIKDGTSKH